MERRACYSSGIAIHYQNLPSRAESCLTWYRTIALCRRLQCIAAHHRAGGHLWRGRAAGGNTTRPSPCRLGCHVACHAAQEGRRGLAAIRPTGGCLPPRGSVAEPSTATDRPPGRWSGAGLTSVWEPRKAGPTAKGGRWESRRDQREKNCGRLSPSPSTAVRHLSPSPSLSPSLICAL